MVLKITKETWEKCGIKTVKFYNKKKRYNWTMANKMNDVKLETGHLNISDTALRRIKDITEKEKNTKHFLKIKMVLLSLKSLHLI